MKRRKLITISTILIVIYYLNLITIVVCDGQSSNGDVNQGESLAESMYNEAMRQMNETKSSGSLKAAYFLLTESSKLNHSQSQELVAKAHLFGDYLPLNLTEAARLFKKLALEGNPTAQLVSFLICVIFMLIGTIVSVPWIFVFFWTWSNSKSS